MRQYGAAAHGAGERKGASRGARGHGARRADQLALGLIKSPDRPLPGSHGQQRAHPHHGGNLYNQDHSVRPDGAYYQWRKIPPRELSIDLVADERLVWATERAEAS